MAGLYALQMLRIPDFSPDHELLLLPCRSEVLGFIRNTGTVQAMAKQELQHFVRMKKLVWLLLCNCLTAFECL